MPGKHHRRNPCRRRDRHKLRMACCQQCLPNNQGYKAYTSEAWSAWAMSRSTVGLQAGAWALKARHQVPLVGTSTTMPTWPRCIPCKRSPHKSPQCLCAPCSFHQKIQHAQLVGLGGPIKFEAHGSRIVIATRIATHPILFREF